MYDLTNILTTVAGCSATVIAIMGGFFANKLIALSVERKDVSRRISDIQKEIDFKSKIAEKSKADLDEDDALDFIWENIEDFTTEQPLEEVYKKRNRTKLTQDELLPYWENGKQIKREMYKELTRGSKTNEDGIPYSISNDNCSNFKYSVCKLIIRNIEKYKRKAKASSSQYSSLLSPEYIEYPDLSILPINKDLWYQKVTDIYYEAHASVEWLEIQKKQLFLSKESLRQPKGMITGLIILIVFSVLGIVFPLILAPFQTNNYTIFIAIKSLVIGSFSLNLLAIFVYYIYLLKRKDNI